MTTTTSLLSWSKIRRNCIWTNHSTRMNSLTLLEGANRFCSPVKKGQLIHPCRVNPSIWMVHAKRVNTSSVNVGVIQVFSNMRTTHTSLKKQPYCMFCSMKLVTCTSPRDNKLSLPSRTTLPLIFHPKGRYICFSRFAFILKKCGRLAQTL